MSMFPHLAFLSLLNDREHLYCTGGPFAYTLIEWSALPGFIEKKSDNMTIYVLDLLIRIEHSQIFGTVLTNIYRSTIQ